jgi:hypothetical protein
MFGHVVHVLGPVWSARLISLTTIFVETFADAFAFGRKVGHGVIHWLSGSSRTWVFMRDNIGPFPSSAVNDYKNNSNVTWHFDLSEMGLTYVDPNFDNDNENEHPENVIIEPQQLPWLSAKIVYNDVEYDIDTFNSEFNFVAPRGVKPTPKLILNCWSIWSGIWLMPGHDARFEIINHEGEEESFFIYSRPSTEVDRWSDLFELDNSSSEAESDEEIEEDEEDEREESSEENIESKEESKAEEEEEVSDDNSDEANTSHESNDSASGQSNDDVVDSGAEADVDTSEDSTEVIENSN